MLIKRRGLLISAIPALATGACVTNSGPPSTSMSGGPGPAPVCTKGQSVHYNARDNFHLDVLVLGDGARAFDAISKYGNEAGPVLYKTVGRYFGPITVTYYLNVNPRRLPPQLPWLIGKGYCMGMTPVLPDEPGWSKVVISDPGKVPGAPVANGQYALVLPRAPLLQLVGANGNHVSFAPAISVNVPTKYNAPITSGRFAGWPSTTIAKPSGTPGVSHVEQRVRSGEVASLFYFVHGRS